MTDTTQAAVPAGWKLVPVEPTDAMIQAAFDALEAYPLQGNIRRHYQAMLAAAPATAEAKEEPETTTIRLPTKLALHLLKLQVSELQRLFETALGTVQPQAEQPTDEQVYEAMEAAFSDTGEWPEDDGAIVRAWIKYKDSV